MPVNSREVRFWFETTKLEVYKDAAGKPHVRAVVSDSLEDRQGDVISERCINEMAKQVSRSIPLLPDHRSSFEMGKSANGDTRRNGETNGLELVVDFELDPRYTESQVLFDEVLNGNCDRQLSIGGMLSKTNPRAAFLEERNGKLIRVLDDIILDHVAVTRKDRAANPRTAFLDAVHKAMDDAGVEVTKEGLKFSERILGRELPDEVKKLDPKLQSLWSRVWKDTFVRQIAFADVTVAKAESAATVVAGLSVAKELKAEFSPKIDSWLGKRAEKETYSFGITSPGPDGHTHAWAAKELGEKILEGLMLTVKGQEHTILENAVCARDGDHEHTLVRKDRKTAEPGAIFAPVGQLYFDAGLPEKDFQQWLEANGVKPAGIVKSGTVFVAELAIEAKKEAAMPGQAGEIEKSAVPYKSWPISNESGWSFSAADGSALLGPKGDDWGRFKQANTYFDQTKGQTPETKGAYGLPHHKLAGDGLQTFTGGVIAATAALNGARGGFRREKSEAGRNAIYSHLRQHYEAAGRQAPPLKSVWLSRSEQKEIVHPNPRSLAEKDFEEFTFALETAGQKAPEWMTKEWWMTWDPEVTGDEKVPETEKAIWVTEVAKDAPKPAAAPAPAAPAPAAEVKKDEPKPAAQAPAAPAPAPATPAPVAKSEPAPAAPVQSETAKVLAEMSATTQKTLGELVALVQGLSKRLDAVEAKQVAPAPAKAEEPKPEPQKEIKPAEPAKPAEAAPVVAKTEKPAEKPADPQPEAKPSEQKPVLSAKDVFSAFHQLLEGLGISPKDFFAGMLTKSMDSIGPSLTQAVQATVEKSLGTLQQGAKADIEKSTQAVEKAITKSVDDKVKSLSGDFAKALSEVGARLEKVEQIGGVRQGADGQEDEPAKEARPKGTFAGIFSQALHRERK